MSAKKIEQAVILAGGRGERLKPFTDEHPKPMFPVGGVPFIDRLIDQVVEFGIKKVLLLLGYKAEDIIDEVGDGSKFGIEITYDITPPEFETGDRFVHAVDKLDDSFLLMYCDNYCPIDYHRLVEEYFKNKASVQLSVYSNKDGYTKNNLIVNNETGRVEVYDKARTLPNLQGVDIGYAVLSKQVLRELPNPAGNLAKALFADLASSGRMYATVTDHRYYSIGSYARLSLTEEFFKDKKVAFLDRDGTLNVRPPRACYIEKPEDFIWLPGAIEAVKKLNGAGYLTILFTNQPGIARGRLKETDLTAIHEKMNRDLIAHNAHIDYIYCCRHNWDDGCDCRKPKPGLLYLAQRELSLNLPKNAIVFGDDERDIEAGEAARCKSVLISEEHTLLQAVKELIG